MTASRPTPLDAFTSTVSPGATRRVTRVAAVADAAEAAARLPELVHDGDTVLVKGSRGVGLEVVAESLTASTRG